MNSMSNGRYQTLLHHSRARHLKYLANSICDLNIRPLDQPDSYKQVNGSCVSN
jgi:hypothetical protein